MPNGREHSGGGGFGCRFGGELALAEAGPAYCHVKAAAPGPSGSSERVLADLRDMKPVATDDGIRLIPTRRARSTIFVGQLAALVCFLNHRNGNIVEQAITRV
jgi:hypothetical protein